MNIQFNSISALSFKENALTTFFAQNKIVVVATVALAALASAFYCLTKLAPNKWLIFKSYFALVKGELNVDHWNGTNTKSKRGTFRKGKLEGEGEKSYSEILIERGTFHEGKLHGQGMLITNDPHKKGKTYSQHVKTEGKFENALLNGFGKITFSDGTFYEGNFVKGSLIQPLGNGKERKINQWGTIEEGYFINGELSGHGKKIIENAIYEGEFQNGKLQGKGKITLDNHFCEGIFEKGDLRKGKVITKNTILEGEFLNGQIHGKGKIIKNNKVTEEGTFVHGKLVRG